MTAIEWLVQQLSKEWILEDRDLYLIEQSKEMEKEQIKGAYIAGGYNNTDREAEIFYMEYYSETFKSE